MRRSRRGFACAVNAGDTDIAGGSDVLLRDALGVHREYPHKLWPALTRYCDDGRIEIDNSAGERAVRGVALGRRNLLFAGADSGGERAAAMCGLIGRATLNSVDPEAWLRYVLAHIADHPVNRVYDFLPWSCADELAGV